MKRLDKKEARREGAKARFKILPFTDWVKTKYGADTILANEPAQLEDAEAYVGYINRKNAEAKSLGVHF